MVILKTKCHPIKVPYEVQESYCHKEKKCHMIDVPSTTYCFMEEKCTLVKMPCKVKVVKPQCQMKCYNELSMQDWE